MRAGEAEAADEAAEAEESLWEPFPGFAAVAWRLPSGLELVEAARHDGTPEGREAGIGEARRKLAARALEALGYPPENEEVIP